MSFTCDECDKMVVQEDGSKHCPIPEDHRELCRKLEEYLRLSVDIKQREQPIKKGYDRLCPKEWPATPSTSELVCRMFFSEHRGVVEIARILEVSHQYVSKTVNKYKKIISQNIKK